MCCKGIDNVVERRFFAVLKRNRDTLLSIIQGEIKPGTTDFLDEWKAWICPSYDGNIHKTVNNTTTLSIHKQEPKVNLIEYYWRYMRRH